MTWAAVSGVAVCLGAAAFELSRAMGGNPVSWVYTFEWPLIATYVIYIRYKLVAEDREGHRDADAPTSSLEATERAEATTTDPGLAAWQEYVARLHAAEPPGGPPAGRSPR